MNIPEHCDFPDCECVAPERCEKRNERRTIQRECEQEEYQCDNQRSLDRRESDIGDNKGRTS